MPRYRTASGVVVDIPEEKATRIDGLTPIATKPSSPRKRPARKPKATDTSDDK